MQGAWVCCCAVMMFPVTPTYGFHKDRAMGNPAALPRVKQTHWLGLIMTQLWDLPVVPAETSWPLPVAVWDSETAQCCR